MIKPFETNGKGENAFSLMEMMVVLMIVAIIAAATAPMITKKLARNAGSVANAIEYFGILGNYGNTSRDSMIIGGNDAHDSKVFINSNNGDQPQLGFGFRNGANRWKLHFNSNNGIILGGTNNTAGANALSLGQGAAAGANAIALGQGANANNENSVAIGASANTTENNQIMLGTNSHTVNTPGNLTVNGTSNLGTTTIGTSAANKSLTVNGDLIVTGKIKTNTIASSGNVDYISYDSTKSAVWIPQGLAVSGDTALALDASSRVGVRVNGNKYWAIDAADGDDNTAYFQVQDVRANLNVYGGLHKLMSDRRLKNVGEKFAGGLAEIKKLDLYNFTFKKDKDKTPQVGVMAQDLKKIFPNAVWEGSDGYLRIRWDEMFYSVINAIKELDSKIETAFEKIKSNTDKVAELQKKVDAQEKVIADLENRLAKLEKNAK